MSDLKNTIVNALPVGASDTYPAALADVVAALTRREQDLSERIALGVNSHFGTDKDVVLGQLALLGMEVPAAPEPEPELEAEVRAPKAKKAKKAKRSKLEEQVRRLVAAAERHGITL